MFSSPHNISSFLQFYFVSFIHSQLLSIPKSWKDFRVKITFDKIISFIQKKIVCVLSISVKSSLLKINMNEFHFFARKKYHPDRLRR
jgi:hypothetical protein